VFDDRPPVTSLKSAIGHTLGASGAIEAAVSTTAIREGIRPPTQNYDTPDPECDVPIVETAQPTEGDVVLSNSAGFGGTNGSLVIERYDH
jgi:3-oxoacyl-[acyl-carrier-protein] synthase II